MKKGKRRAGAHRGGYPGPVGLPATYQALARLQVIEDLIEYLQLLSELRFGALEDADQDHPGLWHTRGLRTRLRPAPLAALFCSFQPPRDLPLQGKTDSSEESEIYKSTHEGPFKKYVPSEPTSPHWYSPNSLQTLVFSHIADSRNGGRDLPLGEFVRQFQGLSSTRKAKTVCSHLPAFTYLSDFEDNPDAVAELLARMQAESKPPKASALGYVGAYHFRAFFESIYEVKEHKYVRRSSTLPSGLPFTFEFALAHLDEPGHLYCGINFSPTLGDPLEGTTLVNPKFKANGIRGFLSQGHALPRTEAAWYFSPASVAVAAHIITPAPIFLDRGKTRLNMEGA
jgi:hypothetical protein